MVKKGMAQRATNYPWALSMSPLPEKQTSKKPRVTGDSV